jgi:hypothetical protein
MAGSIELVDRLTDWCATNSSYTTGCSRVTTASNSLARACANTEAERTSAATVMRYAPASHFNWKTTVPSETVGRAVPRLLAFLAIQSRATRMLSSVPVLSW